MYNLYIKLKNGEFVEIQEINSIIPISLISHEPEEAIVEDQFSTFTANDRHVYNFLGKSVIFSLNGKEILYLHFSKD